MTFEKVRQIAQSVIDSIDPDEDEESVSASVWASRAANYVKLCTEVEDHFKDDVTGFKSPPVQLLLFLGGIVGNLQTSCKLHTNTQLQEAAFRLLATVSQHCCVPSTRQLLLLQPHKSSQPKSENLSIQVLRLCVVHLARSKPNQSVGDPLESRWLYRDTLVWLTAELDYPEIAGEEFISILQPLGLRLTSDYRTNLQLSGFWVLQQLATKARVADWRQNNRAEAVLSHLCEHRISSGPAASEVILHEVYVTMFDLIRLLSEDRMRDWHIKMADRLLFDLTMETRKVKQTVLLKLLLKLMNVMQTDFVAHSRQFLHTVPIILLGPRTPDYLAKSLPEDAQDAPMHTLMLQCVHTFIQLAWPLVQWTTLLPELIPPLIAFVDLESTLATRSGSDRELAWLESASVQTLKSVLSDLVALHPPLLQKILVPSCATVPSLNKLLPVQ
ncbi:hypothetical protein PHET_06594 [Paragonimus heterotremus]|uniref:Uncharacterized protein n=1 Tax=Paragonimus heterotremus TaxID=100268 RepID=A0A8J4WHM3_9TREM|nr:hypothetical protein PHET_06594 [Paragonimus heterotremus]